MLQLVRRRIQSTTQKIQLMISELNLQMQTGCFVLSVLCFLFFEAGRGQLFLYQAKSFACVWTGSIYIAISYLHLKSFR